MVQIREYNVSGSKIRFVRKYRDCSADFPELCFDHKTRFCIPACIWFARCKPELWMLQIEYLEVA